MGLDLAFNQANAMAAGMEFSKTTNGDELDIQEMEREIAHGTAEDGATDYLKWLKEEIWILHVPNTDMKTQCHIGDNNVHVRANTWGAMYAPITEFLSDNGIEWNEY